MRPVAKTYARPSQFILLLSAILITLSQGAMIFGIIWSHVFQIVQTIILLMIYGLPVAVFGYIVPVKVFFASARVLRQPANGISAEVPQATARRIAINYVILKGMFALAFLGLFVAGVLAANKYEDHSPGTFGWQTITGKHFRYAKGSRKTFFATIMSFTISPLSWEAETYEDILVTPQEYERIVPKQTQIGLLTHPGYFGYPWYETSYKFKLLAGDSDNTDPAVNRK